MKHRSPIRFVGTFGLICIVTVADWSNPAHAQVPGDLVRQPADTISQQVEERVENRVEQSVSRRLNQQVEEQLSTTAKAARKLRDRLAVRTSSGKVAFHQVSLPNGDIAVERQWLFTGTAEEIARLRQSDIRIIQRQSLESLGLTVVRFEVPDDLDSRDALARLLPDAADRLDRNHVYRPQAGAGPSSPNNPEPNPAGTCPMPAPVGMVDTGVEVDHPMLKGVQVEQRQFLEEGGETLAEPRKHGTEVAGILATHLSAEVSSDARLFSASVFHGQDNRSDGATLGHLLQGLNWLASQPVRVINISLTGPDNRILETAIQALEKRGILLVAAVGNAGPSAPPLYPAAYPGVIGVTAIDRDDRLYRWANRGNQVMFAARGVNIRVADPGGGQSVQSGTSLAAPVVSAMLACEQTGQSPDTAVQLLKNRARDLGPPGRDPGYGYGAVGP